MFLLGYCGVANAQADATFAAGEAASAASSAQQSAKAAAASAQVNAGPWTSWNTFFGTFLNSKVEIPVATEEDRRTGARWPSAQVERDRVKNAIQRFGREVEFEGIFKRISTPKDDEDDDMIKGTNQKLVIDMPKPDAIKNDDIGLGVHIYPKSDSIQSWQSLKADTKVRFRAVCTGISASRPLPGVVGYTVLLEQAEVVK